MLTKTTYVLDHDELREALENWLNLGKDEQYGNFTRLDVLHEVGVVKDADDVIVAVEFHTESSTKEPE